MVTDGTPCLGPVTHAGCGALCPSYRRGCYGCFGPSESANTDSLDAHLVELGVDDRERDRLWRGYAGWAPEFRAAADRVANAGGGTAAERAAASAGRTEP